MTRYLLDTNLCIACLRRKTWALEALATVPPVSVAVSALTVGELALGAQLSGSFEREMVKVEAFLRPIEILNFGRDEAIQWAAIEAKLRKAGNRIEAEDGIIAATALARGMTLVSGNTRHFDRVKGLKVVDWEKHPPRRVPQP